MRALGCLVLVSSACGFQHGIASTASDAAGDAHEIDVGLFDDVPLGRVKAGLVGFWTFDDFAGSTMAAETSGAASPDGLQVVYGTPTFGAGNLVVGAESRLASVTNAHQNRDCYTAGAVTLEVWVAPAQIAQGTATQPVMIAGLSASVYSRNVSLLQAGNNWLGRVRTNADLNGGPDLLSTTPTSAALTHIVVVASPSIRQLFVNDQLEVETPPAPLYLWDSSYRMMVADEYVQSRPWVGTYALVAIYDVALTPAQVHQNYLAGPDAP